MNDVCCAAMAEELNPGGVSEGYLFASADGDLFIRSPSGAMVSRINCCPWCGGVVDADRVKSFHAGKK